jgi:hypothetical protein
VRQPARASACGAMTVKRIAARTAAVR